MAGSELPIPSIFRALTLLDTLHLVFSVLAVRLPFERPSQQVTESKQIEDLGGSSIIGIFRGPYVTDFAIASTDLLRFALLITADRMASVLVSRFLLDLQDAHLRSVMLDSRRQLSTVCAVDDRTINFAPVAGSLGTTVDLDVGEDAMDYERDNDLDFQDWVMEDDDGDCIDLKV